MGYNLGNEYTVYYELNSLYGHDTFLLDVHNVGAAVKVTNQFCGLSITDNHTHTPNFTFTGTLGINLNKTC